MATAQMSPEERCKQGKEFAYNFENCTTFYQCDNGVPRLKECPNQPHLVFSLTAGRCVFLTDVMESCLTPNSSLEVVTSPPPTEPSTAGSTQRSLATIVAERCAAGEDRFPHPELCHRYFDCNDTQTSLNPYLADKEFECPYPTLYDNVTNTCQMPENVACGEREEFFDACDYSANWCAGPNCRPCATLFTTCRNLTDGRHPWPSTDPRGESQVHWVECTSGRQVGQGTCGAVNGTLYIFSKTLHRCTPFYSIVFELCSPRQQSFPHETDCHRYYDCGGYEYHDGDQIIQRSTMLKTCPYPSLFHVRRRRCEDHRFVPCLDRFEAITPCQYNANLAMCEEEPDYASCVGLTDGKNVYRSREGTPHYVVCQDQRTIEKKLCPVDEQGLYKVFSPESHQCVSVAGLPSTDVA